MMLHKACNMGCQMSIGTSGRIVIEIEPALKRELYSLLAADGLSLKEWFLNQAANYIASSRQPSLIPDAHDHDREPATHRSLGSL